MMVQANANSFIRMACGCEFQYEVTPPNEDEGPVYLEDQAEMVEFVENSIWPKRIIPCNNPDQHPSVSSQNRQHDDA